MRFLLCASILMISGSLSAQAVTFTGNVGNDFPAGSTFILDPGMIDVGMPLAFPPNTTSGWDMERCAIAYNPANDTLYIGFDTYGIAGDADGDGNPNSTGSVLAGLGGTDQPNFSSTESVAAFFDLNNDGTLDVTAGISASTDASGIATTQFAGSIFAAGFAFGAPFPNTTTLFQIPSAAAPDFEMSISNFSSILGQYLQPGQTQIRVAFFMGSFSDAGIGEDYVPEPTPIMLPVSILCTGTPATVTNLGPGCNVAGSPVLTVDPPAQGTTADLTLTSMHPNSHVWIFASWGPVTPYVDPATGCTVYVDILNMSNFYTLWDTFTDANGTFHFANVVPIDPAAIGMVIVLQGRTWFPGGPLNGDWLSNGVQITVGCP